MAIDVDPVLSIGLHGGGDTDTVPDARGPLGIEMSVEGMSKHLPSDPLLPMFGQNIFVGLTTTLGQNAIVKCPMGHLLPWCPGLPQSIGRKAW